MNAERQFEWDVQKAASNEKKHGVSFALAMDVFADPNRIEWIEESKDERRWITVGLADSRELYVVYTLRLERIRLISARKATRHEREVYWNG